MIPLILDESRADVFMRHKAIQVRIPVGIGVKSCVLAGVQVSLFDAPEASMGYEWPIGSGQVVPADKLAEDCPLGCPGTTVLVSKSCPYGKIMALPGAEVVAVRMATVESITDEEIVAEGYENWTHYSHGWSQRYAGMPWDLDPLCWVVELRLAGQARGVAGSN
jgi:hypothetical protein